MNNTLSNSERAALQAANKHMVLDCEDAGLFTSLCRDCIARFQPADPIETRIVERIANALWRLQRIDGLETATLDLALARSLAEAAPSDETPKIITSAFHAASDDGRMPNVLQYESRAARNLNQSLAQLRRLRSATRI